MSGPLISEWHGTPLITTKYIDNLMKFYQGSTLDPLYIGLLVGQLNSISSIKVKMNSEINY
jgi:hypothetical protein